MLWTIVAVLILLWVLGMVSSFTMGGILHALLVLAVVIVLYNLFTGRRALG